MVFDSTADASKTVPVYVDTYDLREAQSSKTVKVELEDARRIVATFRSERNNAAPVVVSAEPGTNAAKAGLRAGDRVTSVGGKPATFMLVTAPFPEGVSSVELTVVSDGPLHVRCVSSELLRGGDGGIELGSAVAASLGAHTPQVRAEHSLAPFPTSSCSPCVRIHTRA
jgi:membrane-associated protease RseP (regulator of RpoE activity)